MYKLLIVDDEPNVRFGLRNYMNWSEYGVEVIGEARDGKPALEFMERERIDILLTDVRMPNVDGIALANEVRTRYPAVKVIFISGHGDVEYMKSALQLSVVDYIFKPVDMIELRAVVSRVAEKLESEKRERRLMEDMQLKLKESMPLLREKFLLSLIREGGRKPEILMEQLHFLGLDLPVEGTYWVVVVLIDDRAEVMGKRSERDRQLLSYALLNIFQELVDLHLRGYVFEHHNGEYVGILQANANPSGDDAGNGLFELAEDIRRNMQRWLSITVTIGIGRQAAGLSSMAGSYEHAYRAAERKWYLGKNQIITMDSLEMENHEYTRFDHASIDRLVSMIKAADPERLKAAFEDLFGGLSYNRLDGFKYVRYVCLQIVMQTGRILLESGMGSRELEEQETKLWEELFRRETIDELRMLLESYVGQVCERIDERRCNKTHNVVERVCEVISRRYSDSDLTIAEIGKEVFLTETYLSLLFKQEMGRNLGEYIIGVRIEKAKELLRDPSYKLYDVCYAVGYTDPSYFGKLFKKMTGMTPSEYRKYLT